VGQEESVQCCTCCSYIVSSHSESSCVAKPGCCKARVPNSECNPNHLASVTSYLYIKDAYSQLYQVAVVLNSHTTTDVPWSAHIRVQAPLGTVHAQVSKAARIQVESNPHQVLCST
jgi:hypothetical protein